MGFFSGLDAEEYDRQYTDRQLISRIVVYFKPHKKKLLLIALMLLIIAGLGALQPILVSEGLDRFESSPSLQIILFTAGSVFVAGVLRWLANWVNRRANTRVIADVVLKLASDAYTAAAEHDLSFYDSYSSGRIVSRITTDTRDFGQLATLVTDLIYQMAQVVILSVVLIHINVRLFIYIVLILPIVFVLAMIYRKLARNVTRQGMRAIADVNSSIKETVSGIAVAKNFRKELTIYNEFDQANRASYELNIRRGLVLAVVFPMLNALSGIAIAYLVYVGGMSVVAGVVTAGNWYLFLQSLDRFMYPVMNLSSFLTQVQTGLAAAERVFALIDAEHAVIQIRQDPVKILKGQIDFQNVNFRYKADEPILDHFDLHIAPGESVALVGHTGAGKSSIAKLIARFYEFQNGEIQVDGKDIRTLNLSDYRSRMGIVPQEPFLFSGTVMENIRYAQQNASDQEIIQLAKQIGDGEWVETLANGLQTEVGERGALLSMGQRQMVSLMRVLVLNPAIFVLDEATASIDPFSESQIQEALNLILKRTTSILIAHRLSTVKSADRILVLEKGRVIEEGDHHTLLQQGGHYAELYNTYFRHQSLEYVEQFKTLMEN